MKKATVLLARGVVGMPLRAYNLSVMLSILLGLLLSNALITSDFKPSLVEIKKEHEIDEVQLIQIEKEFRDFSYEIRDYRKKILEMKIQ